MATSASFDELKLLTAVKREHAVQLVAELAPVFIKFIVDTYERVRKTCKDSRMLLRAFQDELKDVSSWDGKRKIAEYAAMFGEHASIEESLNLLASVYRRALSIAQSSSVRIDAGVDAPVTCYECLLDVAREVWKRPYLVYHKVSAVDLQKNRNALIGVVKMSVESTLNRTMPLKDAYQRYLSDVAKLGRSDEQPPEEPPGNEPCMFEDSSDESVNGDGPEAEEHVDVEEPSEDAIEHPEDAIEHPEDAIELCEDINNDLNECNVPPDSPNVRLRSQLQAELSALYASIKRELLEELSQQRGGTPAQTLDSPQTDAIPDDDAQVEDSVCDAGDDAGDDADADADADEGAADAHIAHEEADADVDDATTPQKDTDVVAEPEEDVSPAEADVDVVAEKEANALTEVDVAAETDADTVDTFVQPVVPDDGNKKLSVDTTKIVNLLLQTSGRGVPARLVAGPKGRKTKVENVTVEKLLSNPRKRVMQGTAGSW